MPDQPGVWVGEFLLCKPCDVFAGYGAIGVVRMPVDKDEDWLMVHCWLCERDYSSQIEPGGDAD
jgi:hypothetical protein